MQEHTFADRLQQQAASSTARFLPTVVDAGLPYLTFPDVCVMRTNEQMRLVEVFDANPSPIPSPFQSTPRRSGG